jgi:copper chaperone CopZ
VRWVTGRALKDGPDARDKGLMKARLLLTFALLGAVTAAHAEPRVYELSVPAVQCSYSSQKAVEIVEAAVPISYVKADPRAHRVTVRFEDEKTSLEAITTALSAQGYSVKRQKQLR